MARDLQEAAASDYNFDRRKFYRKLMADPLISQVWSEKYRFKNERDVYETHARIVEGLYAKDPDTKAKQRTRELLDEGAITPAGRINSGVGTDKRTTPLNCFVTPVIQDHMPGILQVHNYTQMTMQQGGGVGQDFSTVRPAGALVKRTQSISSGTIPFMRMWNTSCQTIVSSGSRRGAMMFTLRDDHPDLWNPNQWEVSTDYYTGKTYLKEPSFISAKTIKGELTNANISVLVSDAFMFAVFTDGMWDLGFHVPRADGNHVAVYDKPFPYDYVEYDNEFNELPEGRIAKGTMLPWYVYRRVRARDLWDEIIRTTFTYAEPGVIFIDRVNKLSPLSYCEDMRCTNPCSELPLPPNGCCCLGSTIVSHFVRNPFTADAYFDWEAYDEAVYYGVRMLDNVLDTDNWPLPAQQAEAKAKRRIGLGYTSFADALIMLGIRYGSSQAVEFADTFGSFHYTSALRASINLAKERGSFEAFDADAYLNTEWAKALPEELRQEIRNHGVRNGVLTTVAPNGTVSIYVGNVSSGHEPIFSFDKSTRKVRQSDNSMREFENIYFVRRLYEELFGLHATSSEIAAGSKHPELPDTFISAQELSVNEHLLIHTTLQKYIDTSLSKTINCPEDMPYEDFKAVYSNAYHWGAKGCTTYRPSDVRGSVLEVKREEVPAAVVASELVDPDFKLPERPEFLGGGTYRIKWPQLPYSFYVTINHVVDEATNTCHPYEVFIQTKDPGATEWVTALSILISAVLRRGGDVDYIPAKLKTISSPQTSAFYKGGHRKSLVAFIGQIIEREFARIKQLHLHLDLDSFEETKAVEIPTLRGELCPNCGEETLFNHGGCRQCSTCTFQTCS